ncbi:MAG: M28 family metallopeptidase [Promethearchaeota archaeon]
MNRVTKFSGTTAFEVCRHLAQSIGVRVHGLETNLATKNYLLTQLSQYGLENVHAEAFPVLTSRQKKAQIILKKHKYDGLSFGLSGRTEVEGISGPVVKYTSWSWNPTPQFLASISEKIIILYTRNFSQEIVQDLIEAGVQGIIHVTYYPGIPPKLPMGFIYSALNTGDFDILPPVISVSYEDGAQLLANARELTIHADVTILQSESYNILGEIPGEEPDVILLSAHYDTAPYSPGAADNAGGTAILLELARIFANSNPRWTLRFLATGSEECALQGARSYCKTNSPALEEIKLNLNFDVQGTRVGNLALGVIGEKRLLTRVEQSIRQWKPEIRQAPTGGDNRIFAHYGIPAIHWWFGGGVNFLLNHTPHDRIENIAPQSLEFVGQAAEAFMKELTHQRTLRFSIPKTEQENNYHSIQPIMRELNHS